jgi:hypothetical protein
MCLEVVDAVDGLALSLRSIVSARRSINYTTGFLIRSSSVDAPHWFDGQELEKTRKGTGSPNNNAYSVEA